MTILKAIYFLFAPLRFIFWVLGSALEFILTGEVSDHDLKEFVLGR